MDQKSRVSRRLIRNVVAVAFVALMFLMPPPARAAENRPFLLHLNGIGGHLLCDDAMVAGLRAGGLIADVRFYDWTGPEHGLVALQAYERNRQEARKVAAIITQRFRRNPNMPIYLTAHSGGAGPAVWALEDLPADVKVEAVLLLAPALSPRYDLSAALRHVRRAVYVFSSPYDSAILSAGTKLFGTVDGVHGEAAGLHGFVRPAGADAKQYAKLVPQPYQKDWLRRYGHIGSHVCPMRMNFARDYLAPLLLRGKPPTTQPAQTAATAAKGADRP